MDIKRVEDVTEWKNLDGVEHLQYSILHIDDEQTRAEVLFKMEPHKPIILHRHCALNKIVVLSGEHRIYEPDGTLKEVRATGSYTVSQPDDEPHAESGGDGGAVMLFSIFENGGGPLYELMDPERNIVGTLSMADLVALNQ
ncbi:MAG: regulator [Pseudomonadota bacterium]